jgi:uncharacterized protein YjbJ (UPF0337 family)
MGAGSPWQWGKLTDDDFDIVAGKRDQISGLIQERYGIAKDEADRQIAAWSKQADESWWDAKHPM